jgi:hypothetical protein
MIVVMCKTRTFHNIRDVKVMILRHAKYDHQSLDIHPPTKTEA